MKTLRLLVFVLVAGLCPLRAAEDRVGGTLSAWSPGFLDIHQISTGKGNSALLILPDGTTLLVDAGAAGDLENTTIRPNASRTPGEWIARYVKGLLSYRTDPAIDYAVLTHLHADHIGGVLSDDRPDATGSYLLTGITEVAESIPIRKLFDRGWPDYDYPVALRGPVFENYRAFLKKQIEVKGLQVEKLRAGQSDQLSLLRDPDGFPDFEIRNVSVNGQVWTGQGTEAGTQFPALETLKPEDYPSENMCSISLRIRYASFDYFTGGDLPGVQDTGFPAWGDVETPIARAIGAVDVAVVNHHGSIDPSNPFFLSTLQPRVHIIPTWAPTHPAPSVLRRLLSERLYPGPRDVFTTGLHPFTAAVIGPRAEQVKNKAGHVVVRVAPGGGSYTVLILDDTSGGYKILASYGPYASR